MLVFGLVLVAAATALAFTDQWLANYVNNGAHALADLILHVWSLIVQLGMPLGSFLIVGSIIVKRLPESAPKDASPSPTSLAD